MQRLCSDMVQRALTMLGERVDIDLAEIGKPGEHLVEITIREREDGGVDIQGRTSAGQTAECPLEPYHFADAQPSEGA